MLTSRLPYQPPLVVHKKLPVVDSLDNELLLCTLKEQLKSLKKSVKIAGEITFFDQLDSRFDS